VEQVTIDMHGVRLTLRSAYAGLVSGTVPDDVDSLASELRRVLDDPDSGRAQAVRARDWVLCERTWAANARRLEGLCTLLGV